MRIEINFNGRNSEIRCEGETTPVNTVWLKRLSVNDLYEMLKNNQLK